MSWNTLDPALRDHLAKRLSHRQYDVYVLWLAGCSYQRISTMLNISPRTVRTHLHRAKAIRHQHDQEKAA